jgi:hypothetical protein
MVKRTVIALTITSANQATTKPGAGVAIKVALRVGKHAVGEGILKGNGGHQIVIMRVGEMLIATAADIHQAVTTITILPAMAVAVPTKVVGEAKRREAMRVRNPTITAAATKLVIRI